MLTCGVRIGVGAHPNHRSALLRQCRRRPQREREDGEKKREEDRRTGRRSAREDRQAAPRLGSCREMSSQVGTSLPDRMAEAKAPASPCGLVGDSAAARLRQTSHFGPSGSSGAWAKESHQGIHVAPGYMRQVRAGPNRRSPPISPTQYLSTECRFPCKATLRAAWAARSRARQSWSEDAPLWAGLTAGDRYHLGGSARSDENDQALAEAEGKRGQQKGNRRDGVQPNPDELESRYRAES